MIICEKHFKNGGEVDYTAWYPKGDGIHYGRLSLRKRGSRYELYVFWFDTKCEEVIYASADLKDVVRKGNEIMRSLGYEDWNDVVGEEDCRWR